MSALGQAGITISNVARAQAGRAALPWHVERARGMGVVALAIEWFRHDTALRRSRRALLELTEEQLRDVGLTRRQARTEAQRSFHVG